MERLPLIALRVLPVSVVSGAFGWKEVCPSNILTGAKPIVGWEKVSSSSGLFDFETFQLTDNVLAGLKKTDPLTDTSIFSFRSTVNSGGKSRFSQAQERCKTYPGDPGWPSEALWRLFNVLLDGALIKTVPEASLCFPSWGQYSADACEKLTANWNNSTLR